MTTPTRPILRSQRLRLVNHQGDALRLGMNWTEEDLGKPLISGNDKSVPAHLVAIARCDLPAIHLPGAPS